MVDTNMPPRPAKDDIEQRKQIILAALCAIDLVDSRWLNLRDTDITRIWNKLAVLIEMAKGLQSSGAIPPTPLLKLYLIYNCEQDANGDFIDRTRFIRATNPVAAWGFWKKHCGLREGFPGSVYVREIDSLSLAPYGVVAWSDIKKTCVSPDGTAEDQ